MKKEVIIVPKDKSPLDVLAEMKEQIRDSWIFLHENAYQHLLESEGADYSTENSMNMNRTTLITWKATEEHSKIIVFCEVPSTKWGKITGVKAENICFNIAPSDPKEIYFLKMEE